MGMGRLRVVRFGILCLGAFLIGLSKAGFGGGGFLVVTPLLALVLPPKVGLGPMLPLLLATDVMALVRYRGQWDRRCVGVLLPPALVGIGHGGALVRGVASDLHVREIGQMTVRFGAIDSTHTRRVQSLGVV